VLPFFGNVELSSVFEVGVGAGERKEGGLQHVYSLFSFLQPLPPKTLIYSLLHILSSKKPWHTPHITLCNMKIERSTKLLDGVKTWSSGSSATK
jgi:hypothetical protein